jgi:hypothetical protein
MGMFDIIFDPKDNLSSLKERLGKAKEGVSDRVYGPIHQAFMVATQRIAQRVEDNAKIVAMSEAAVSSKKSRAISTDVTTNVSTSVTEEEINLEVVATARGIATNEYGNSQNRPTGVVRQEALGLQVNAERILKDVLEEV